MNDLTPDDAAYVDAHRGDAVVIAAAAGVRSGLAMTLARAFDQLAVELDKATYEAVATGRPLLLADRAGLADKARWHATNVRAQAAA